MDTCWQCCSSALLIYLESTSLLVLVEWFHQKDYPLHAEVWASGSIKCQQFIGGTIPPGSSGAPSKRRMYVCWQCWSPALLIHFKPIPQVEWSHNKNYPLHAKLGASGHIKCQQLIGGTIPPGSGGACTLKEEDAC